MITVTGSRVLAQRRDAGTRPADQRFLADAVPGRAHGLFIVRDMPSASACLPERTQVPRAPPARLVSFGCILTTQSIAGGDLGAHRANAVKPAVLVSHVPGRGELEPIRNRAQAIPNICSARAVTKRGAEPTRPERRFVRSML
jgi:hypothetical protein